MAKKDYREVRAAVVEANPPLRTELRAALTAKGILNPIICSTRESFLDVAANENLDIIVCDATTVGDGFITSMQRIRRNDMGGNPFAAVIATVHDSSMDGVRAVLDSGVDHMLLKPTPVSRILERIDTLVWERRPFIVTNGYVGPTRRETGRPTDDRTVVLNVPNTLRGKVVDKIPDAQLEKMIRQAVAGLQEKMAQHPLLGIDRLIQRTQAYVRGGGGADELKRDFAYLMKLGVELSKRYAGTRLAHIADLAMALAGLAKRIANSDPDDLRKLDFEPLAKLGEVIRRAIAAEERAAESAQARAAAGASPVPPAARVGTGSWVQH